MMGDESSRLPALEFLRAEQKGFLVETHGGQARLPNQCRSGFVKKTVAIFTS